MQYGIDNFFYRRFDEEGVAFDETLLGRIPVAEGQTDAIGETAYTAVEIRERRGTAVEGEPAPESAPADSAEDQSGEGLLLRKDEQIRVKCNMADSLTAPVAAGTPVGSIEYIVNDTVYLRETIVTADDVDKIDLRWCALRIVEKFLL